MTTHPILVTLSVGEPFWILDNDLTSFNLKLWAGKAIWTVYGQQPKAYGPAQYALGMPAWVNPKHVVAAVLFPAVPHEGEL